MLNVKPWMARLLTPAVLALAVGSPAVGQIKALRNSDDQFIQGLREQGMSDLLGRFVDTDPPQDPIARLALDVALKEFVADDLYTRAGQASEAQNYDEAVALLNQSRDTFKQVLAAQEQLIADHAEDERVPLWQTDYAEMLLYRYLPRYYQDVNWVYEFGMPSAEQREAFEDAIVKAFKATDDAVFRLGLLINRVGANPELQQQLEEQGIWYKLLDYQQINAPYWQAQAAHGVSLLPNGHPYFSAKIVRNQKTTSAIEEKMRLRDLVVESLGFKLMKDERTTTTAKLFSGRTLVWSTDRNVINEGVDEFLEDVIAQAADTPQGYIATLSKAVGRWQGGEVDVALEILRNMERHPYVRADGSTTSRLLAADLQFRILMAQAKDALPDQKQAKIAEAYETAYVPLVDKEDDPRYRYLLFERWAKSVSDSDDPAMFPPMVRMGIGEQLTQQGSYAAQLTLQAKAGPEPVIPAEADRWLEQLNAQRAKADELLARAAKFNQTLIGEEMQGPVLARALYNLAWNTYWRAELKHAFEPEKYSWKPYYEAATYWLAIGQRAPDAAKTQESLTIALNLLVGMDVEFNSPEILEQEVRASYRSAFELLIERWPQLDVVHNNRVYAGFHLYEKLGEWEMAIAVYRGLPRPHQDYFQARRQLLFVLQRQYREMTDRLLYLKATEPSSDPPRGADDKAKEAHAQLVRDWQVEHDTLDENLTRVRDDIIEEATVIQLDADDEVKNADDIARRFTAATAMGAAKVVLAGVLADQEPAKGRALLQGFEEQFGPDGEFGKLAGLQAKPDGAKANLRGLVQSAQQQRILILLAEKKIDEMAEQAQIMMDASPDVAAGVIDGVLKRIETTIERERRAVRESVFEVERDKAQANIRFQADAAVKLGEKLVEWAKKQKFDDRQMVPFWKELADALILAGKEEPALDILQKQEKLFPNNFEISMQTGKAHLAIYKLDTKNNVKNYNGAMENFTKIITYYNQRREKPAMYWDAWLHVCMLLQAAGGDQAKQIASRVEMLVGVDPELGGPDFKDRFLQILKEVGSK